MDEADLLHYSPERFHKLMAEIGEEAARVCGLGTRVEFTFQSIYHHGSPPQGSIVVSLTSYRDEREVHLILYDDHSAPKSVSHLPLEDVLVKLKSAKHFKDLLKR